MITKFKSIKNLAVYQNFNWDTTMRDDGNNVVLLKSINIFYGRNYSGKTTLSRIIRALEIGSISDKYEDPQFEITIDGVSTNVTQENLVSHGKKIRVFNEDFVKDNLRFIANSDENITPFAIIGGNATIETEIQSLKKDLGSNDEGVESGFYLELKNANSISTIAFHTFDTEENLLNDQLTEKALNRETGIKYKSERFGDQNYTKSKLTAEIGEVLESSFKALTDEQLTVKSNLLNERANTDIPLLTIPKIDLQSIAFKAQKLVSRSISNSNKIEELLKDAIINRWVKEGRQIHKNKLQKCSFCDNEITNERWNELDSHFDEESEKLEKEIEMLISEIEILILDLNEQLPINKNAFYTKFHLDLDRLFLIKQNVIDKIETELNRIKVSLQERKNDLLNSKSPITINDNTRRLGWCYEIFQNYRIQANEYGKSLGSEQIDARKTLRLREVSDFVRTIQYTTKMGRIEALKENFETVTKIKEEIEQKIKHQIMQIEDKERLMNDEEKGALKVNEYLNNFFGHDFLTLKALENVDKKIRFEIVRNGKKAHHLSEGECSLIAFCYFMAKLEDIETKNSKPIIWIDDPISSLDSNHIFFIYSLINAEIIETKEFEQIFISTHNLDFLKYLKRLPSALNSKHSEYFLISREKENSKIRLMPRYLKDYVTEFNYLFHQIYMCSTTDPDDENHHNLFYNFGNNTRKFLEAFLYYKYPNAVEKDDKLKRFFGDNRQATVMTDRINNEFSHLEGLFERSMTPIDSPEMKKTAKFILDKIREKDNDQYEALLLSIGVENETEIIS